MTIASHATLTALLALAAHAAAQNPPASISAAARSAFALAPATQDSTPASTSETPEAESPAAEAIPAHEPVWGDRGAWSLSLTGGVAFSSDATGYSGDASLSVFAADDFEFRFGLAGWGFDQDGEDAAAVNPNFSFRWHFISDRPAKNHSVYIDTGIGLLLSDNDVPEGGTDVNFTPRAGLGATFRLGDSANRLDVGASWHHISNASFSGSDENPDRDGITVYVGIIIPF